VHHPMPSSGAGGGTGKSQASTVSTLSGRKTMSQTLDQPNKVWHVTFSVVLLRRLGSSASFPFGHSSPIVV
jgi:hypothetical protein